jgi:hypothetical protein
MGAVASTEVAIAATSLSDVGYGASVRAYCHPPQIVRTLSGSDLRCGACEIASTDATDDRAFKSHEAVAANSAGRVFTSADSHVAGAANAIEAVLPGRVAGVNVNRTMTNGLSREVDIDLGNIIVQVKGGQAKGLTGQILETQASTGVRTIGYAPGVTSGAWRSAAERGIVIARSQDELLAYLREFG